MRRLCILALAGAAGVSACTTYAAGRLATADGTVRPPASPAQRPSHPPTASAQAPFRAQVWVTHSDDGAGASDPRVSYVPAADWDDGALRPIWPDLEDYPRFVGSARGKTYHPLAGQKETEPIGSIPQVRRTKGYWESNYALQNECGLSFGASTASALPLTLRPNPAPIRFPIPNPSPHPNPNQASPRRRRSFEPTWSAPKVRPTAPRCCASTS